MDILKFLHAGVSRHDIARLNQVNILYSQALTTYLFPVIAGLCLVLLLWGVSPPVTILSWFSVICLHTVSRYLLLRRYHQSQVIPGDADSWLNRFAVSAFISGALWGIAPLILVSHDEHIELIIFNGLTMLIICGLVSGASISYAVSLRVLVAYTIPALIPPALYLISLGDLHNSSLGGYVLLYYVFITIASIRMNTVLSRFIEMEQEKTETYYKYEKLKSVYADYRRKIGV